jgi:hypothetical protein
MAWPRIFGGMQMRRQQDRIKDAGEDQDGLGARVYRNQRGIWLAVALTLAAAAVLLARAPS